MSDPLTGADATPELWAAEAAEPPPARGRRYRYIAWAGAGALALSGLLASIVLLAPTSGHRANGCTPSDGGASDCAAAPGDGQGAGAPVGSLVPSASRSASAAPSRTAAAGAPPGVALPPGVFTDLASAPVGGFVSVYGIDSATASWPVVQHGNGRTVVRVPDAAPALTIGGRSIPVQVHAGRVITVGSGDEAGLRAAISGLRPGDAVYLHAGSYSGKYDPNGWNESNFVIWTQGSAAQPIALAAYPGETVTFTSTSERPNFYLGQSGGAGRAAYLTIAGFNLRARGECVYGGGNTATSDSPESGGSYVRVVGNTCTLTDDVFNAQSGMFAVQGDGWRILGNTFVNSPARVIYNLCHALYIQNGADDVEVAYNVMRNLRMGHVIQVHQDGTPMLYADIRIHDNLFEGAQPSDMRGINVANVDDASTVVIENNTLRNLGQDFSGIAIYRGHVTIRNNLMYRIMAPAVDLNSSGYGGARTVTASGNRFETVNNYPAVSAANMNEITLSGNSYCGSAKLLTQDPGGTACP